ncbi:MAG: nuclear transport factor 2 family protein [Candidatus Eremiobacteraeota bacterium]|nr:nuclear transport factor 2 family protein [Candidatus Eremiobacteraeota bacterium]
MRIVVRIFVVLSLGLSTAGPASADAQMAAIASVMAPVHQFFDGFNQGDEKRALAACAPFVSIVDEVPPHAWHGASACSNWARDYAADGARKNVTDGVVTLGTLRTISVDGSTAYVIVSARYVYKVRGKPASEPHATFTAALTKTGAGWRIAAWTWTAR